MSSLGPVPCGWPPAGVCPGRRRWSWPRPGRHRSRKCPTCPAAAPSDSAGREPAGRRGSGSAGVSGMRLLVLGGTHFLGRHVATAALRRGHDVATFTRGVSGTPPEGARALLGDRDDPAALPAALDGWRPDLVVDTSCQTRAAARNAAAALGDVRGYAFVSSLNAYENWPPGPIGPEDDEPTWTTDDDEYGPIKAFAEREIGAAVGDGFL